MIEPIDIFLTTFNRKAFTERTIAYINNRTKYPHRLFVIDNGSTDGTTDVLRRLEKAGAIFHWLSMSKNIGIHMAWNTALGLASSEFMVTMDNDLYVPDLEPCWLEQLRHLMNIHPSYAAIAAQPHTYLGASSPTVYDEGVADVGHCGAVARLMKTALVKQVGGWERSFDSKRNHEEKTICGRLRDAGFKVGYAQKIFCYHDFGKDDNWGYEDIAPHDHGHRIPGEEIWPTPNMLSHEELYDTKTWELKK
jgi:GT2 family glycosyltransferase